LNVNTGAFIVTGSDSTTSTLIVGNHGTGTLRITDGAELNVPGFNSRVTLGNHATSVGTATISGVGSTWINNNQLRVGGSGTGTLTIQAGGRLRCTSSANSPNVIGFSAGASGAVTVTGPGSTWTYSNELRVGNGGDGTLTVTDGGTVISNVFGSAQVGGSGTGTATVTGAGSTWSHNGFLQVGPKAGAVAVLNGGRLTTGGSLIRGLNAGSGQVRVAGADSTWRVDGSLTIGLPEPGFTTGPTSLTIGQGGTVTVDQDIILNTNGVLKLGGGTLSVGTITLQFNGTFEWTSGTLHVDIFRGSLTNQGGKLVPGVLGLSAGNTIIDDNYIQHAGAELEIKIGGTTSGTQYDFVDVKGHGSLDGLLRLTLIDNFVPAGGQTFTILASSGIAGVFSNVADGQKLTTTDGLGSFVVNYEPADALGRHHIVLTDFTLA
jgi:fibronectin-binding autotransporter adhesin